MMSEVINFITDSPKTSILILSAVVTLISSLITKWLTNQTHLKQMKERQKFLQKELKNHKPGEKMFQELQNEMLQITMTMMKSSFRPLLVTGIPFLLLLGWMKSTYDPILANWIWYYIGFSIVCSLIYRKVLDLA